MTVWSHLLATYRAARDVEKAFYAEHIDPRLANLPIGAARNAAVDSIPPHVMETADALTDAREVAEEAMMNCTSPNAAAFACKYLVAHGDDRDSCSRWDEMLETEANRLSSPSVDPHRALMLKWHAAITAANNGDEDADFSVIENEILSTRPTTIDGLTMQLLTVVTMLADGSCLLDENAYVIIKTANRLLGLADASVIYPGTEAIPKYRDALTADIAINGEEDRPPPLAPQGLSPFRVAEAHYRAATDHFISLAGELERADPVAFAREEAAFIAATDAVDTAPVADWLEFADQFAIACDEGESLPNEGSVFKLLADARRLAGRAAA